MMKKLRPAGRPPKFTEPSVPITITLPNRILEQLEKVDSDRGKAIVKCVEGIAATSLSEKKRVEIVKISDNSGLIVIGPCRCLESIPWLQLIEIAPARFLLSIPHSTDAASLEVAIMDLIENPPTDNEYEIGLLKELRQCISHHRRQEGVTKGQILLINLDNPQKKQRWWSFVLPMEAGIESFKFDIDPTNKVMMWAQTFCELLIA